MDAGAGVLADLHMHSEHSWDCATRVDELLDAALAACTALTLTLYARHKGIELAALEVEVDHEEHDGVYRMRRDIHVTGELSAEQRTRMLEIANKCPVHRTLSGSFDIVSQLH